MKPKIALAMLVMVVGVFFWCQLSEPDRVLDALCEDRGYRIMFDGTMYKVQERSYLGGWSDDTWGGYFPSLSAAQDRIEHEKKFHRQRRIEKGIVFKEVK